LVCHLYRRIKESLFIENNIYIPKSELKENGEKQGGKSVSKNQKWTKKMSNFPKRKYFMKKGSKFPPCELKGQKRKKKSEKSVTLIFKYFCGKGFRRFFC